MIRKLIPAAVVFATISLGFACQVALARTEDTKNAWPAFSGHVKETVEVKVLDERPYVLSGDKPKSFVGIGRGLYGIPFDVTTASELTLAQDLDNALVNGLRNSGVSAVTAGANVSGTRKASAPERRLLVITLKQWKSDTYKSSTSFHYDIGGAVYDAQGTQLSNHTINGIKSVSSGVDGGRQALTDLLASNGLFADPPVKGASNAPTLESEKKPASTASMTVEDRLLRLKKLFDSGLISNAEYDQKRAEILTEF